MTTRTHTVAFQGIEAKLVEVQCALAPGLAAFQIVGLPDKAVSEARERVRSAITTLGLAMPSKKITINLSPADMPKEGSHFDLPIALAVLAAMDVIPSEEIERAVVMGELSLDGNIAPVLGALPAAIAACSQDLRLICPKSSGAEAAWVGAVHVTGATHLKDCLAHLQGHKILAPAEPGEIQYVHDHKDMQDVKGQERAKRALEIAAAGRHHLLFVGTPGSGKSMLAARLPGLLPPLSAEEALETSMVHSISGLLDEGGISRIRPFRDPHHTASMAAIVGGGRGAKPGEVSLAHNGVLFLDELPEFPRMVLETLRQPIETGKIMVSRANAHVSYPCRFMLIAAANPCRCGHLYDPGRACGQAPLCGEKYLGRLSGPLIDRFDLRIEVPPVEMADLSTAPKGEPSATIAKRVHNAWTRQADRFRDQDGIRLNADAEGKLLEQIATPDAEGQMLLSKAADRFGLTARGYHRVLRVARTIADLEAAPNIRAPHVAEALSYRLTTGFGAETQRSNAA
ncbi:MAG: YifB family Mg chelatase-like AAA ATPase [Pseudomonadota bacterium]